MGNRALSIYVLIGLLVACTSETYTVNTDMNEIQTPEFQVFDSINPLGIGSRVYSKISTDEFLVIKLLNSSNGQLSNMKYDYSTNTFSNSVLLYDKYFKGSNNHYGVSNEMTGKVQISLLDTNSLEEKFNFVVDENLWCKIEHKYDRCSILNIVEYHDNLFLYLESKFIYFLKE